MSIWHKEIDQITFADVDTFCLAGIAEGTRLDYKVDVPKELAKIVAAFANTLGGMIMLGVDADRTTNKPIWPPTKGMLSKRGIDEQITQICRDNIYPPVQPQISDVLPNEKLPGHVVTVVRVDESREAPHAINNGRHVYVRTGL
jgi:predicted HTH transcriptional regulator